MLARKSRTFWIIALAGVVLSSEGLASYVQAQRFLKMRDYRSAAPAFYTVYKNPRNKSEYRKAEWGLAESLRKLGLFYSASNYYSVIVRRGRKGSNPFFRSALEKLGQINRQISLGESHIKALFKAKVRASDVPGPARGFYFYYKGVDAFNKSRPQLDKARRFFQKVPSSSPYRLGAKFHLGVINNLSGRHSASISTFQSVLSSTRGRSGTEELYQSTLMNLARVYYEKKRYKKAITYYGQIPRDSSYWLDAVWETSWAFFFMQKFKNTLGQIHTIHSPFFANQFYPETYILQAITFLRLCRIKEAKRSMRLFKQRYNPTFKGIKAMLNRYKSNPKNFFKFVNRYEKSGRMSRFRNAEEVVKKLTKMDAFKGARDIVRFSQREIEALRGYGGRWRSSGLVGELKGFLRGKKGTAVRGAGRRMYQLGTTYYSQLMELSQQTKLIVAEIALGNLDKMREIISDFKAKTKTRFIGGMQPLSLNQSLEYWPFEQEYWEDELGFYVYNLGSRCRKGKGK